MKAIEREIKRELKGKKVKELKKIIVELKVRDSLKDKRLKTLRSLSL